MMRCDLGWRDLAIPRELGISEAVIPGRMSEAGFSLTLVNRKPASGILTRNPHMEITGIPDKPGTAKAVIPDRRGTIFQIVPQKVTRFSGFRVGMTGFVMSRQS
ncbi:hypothetical protein QUF72_05415 [Desulfobacterales bacterium HSG2]|nr:hypothetical protein [Desulfobacterales bacterium HSG2]